MSAVEGLTEKAHHAGIDHRSTWLGWVDAIVEKSPEQKTRSLSQGASLVCEGHEVHSIFVVQSGWLAASKSLPDGDRLIVEVILPGDIYDPVSGDGDTSFITLEALSPVEVVVVGRTAWARLMDELPDLQRFEERKVWAARARQSEWSLRLGKSSAEARIAYGLIELCIRMTAIGAVEEDGSFHIPMGQQQLAEFTGLSSVHVCRTLRRLNRQGAITTGDHMDIKIHDSAALADIAGVDIDMLRRAITADAP